MQFEVLVGATKDWSLLAFYAMLICKYLPVFQTIMVSRFMESISLDSKTLKMKAVQSLEMSGTNGLMIVCHFPGDFIIGGFNFMNFCHAQIKK